MDYEVALTLPDLAPARLSPSDHIAAEVRFAAALERACAPSGGIVDTFRHSEAHLDAWSSGEASRHGAEPDTDWKKALRAAEAEVWRALTRPAGALFEVRVVSPADDFVVFEQGQGVPF